MSLGNPVGNPTGNPLALSSLSSGSNIGDIVTRIKSPGANFLPCDGRQLPKAANSKLYSAIGDAYTVADFSAGVTTVTLPASIGWTGIAYGNGIFVAVSSTTTGSISSDGGKTWTSMTTPFGCIGIAFGAGVFVIIYNLGKVATSTDGSTWVVQSTPITATWQCIAFGGGSFVIVGAGTSGENINSKDGKTWVAGAAVPAITWRSMAYGNGIFVAVGGGSSNSVRSIDGGMTWTPGNLGLNQTPDCVGFINGVFVVMATTGTQTVTSGNGFTWFLSPAGQNEPNSKAITPGPGCIFAAGYDGAGSNIISYNGFDWVVVGGTTPGGNRTAAAYGNGVFIALHQSSAGGANRIDVFQAANFNLPKIPPNDGLHQSYIRVS